MKQSTFDVVVVGGGHAGIEAASVAARCGLSVSLVTMRADTIGAMSCNPAVGGIGKGHLVREIDALGGLMGHLADRTGIQFRLLNLRKGPAVRGPRVQCDRHVYAHLALQELRALDGLRIIEGEVLDIVQRNGRVAGVELQDGSCVDARRVIVTTGTFLGGVMHIGNEQIAGGRMGDAASTRLAARFASLGLPLGRLKTGTPPRLDGRTIDWTVLERQPGDDDPTFLSFGTDRLHQTQIACGITHTNARTHEIVAQNLKKSAVYGGQVETNGPRYCPSIEDKIVRFPDKTSHQIFLEPEGLSTDVVYPNGISSSLPRDVQVAYVRSVRGLEKAHVLRFGYAVAYDYVDPRALTQDLEVKALPGLFLAGQINGTTGYEEAAGQGLVAGLSVAAQVTGRRPVRLDRTNSYLGVMVDDLTGRGVTEPYRMFTSRAEFRLSLRIDNADERLTESGRVFGCVSDAQATRWRTKSDALQACKALLRSRRWRSKEVRDAGIDLSDDGTWRNGLELLAATQGDIVGLTQLEPRLAEFTPRIRDSVANDALYSVYIERQTADAERLLRDIAIRLNDIGDYKIIGGLSGELVRKLERIRPTSLHQAAKIEGMTPAGLIAILAYVQGAARVKAPA